MFAAPPIKTSLTSSVPSHRRLMQDTFPFSSTMDARQKNLRAVASFLSHGFAQLSKLFFSYPKRPAGKA